jgi:hypothetical protein
MQKETKPIIAFVLGFVIVILFPTLLYLVFLGMILIAIGIIDLAWITIQPPKPKKHISREDRRETLKQIKKAVKKRK